MATLRSATVASLDRELLLSQAKSLEQYLNERQLIKDRKYRLKSYNGCFIGSEVILPIINLQFASNESEAIQFGNDLINAGILAHVEGEHKFRNQHLFYSFTEDLSTTVNLQILHSLRKDKTRAQTLTVHSGQQHSGAISPQRSYTKAALSPHAQAAQQDHDHHSDSSEDLYTEHLASHPVQVTRAPPIPHNASRSSGGTPRTHLTTFNPLPAPMTTHSKHFFSESPSSVSSPIQITQIQLIQSLQQQIQNLQQQIQAMSTKYFTLESTMTSLREQVEHRVEMPHEMPGSLTIHRAASSQEGSTAVTAPMYIAAEHYEAPTCASMHDAKDEKTVDVMQVTEEVVDKTPPLLNKWIHFGDAYSTFAVHKIGAIVYLQGCLKGGAVNSIVCQLPFDCRPKHTMTFCFDQHNAINGRMRILNNGNVFPEYMNKNWIYLDGISFIAAQNIDQPVRGQAMIENITPKLENKWVEFGSGYASFKAYKCGNVVYLEGCVKNGAMNSTVATLPVQCRPRGTLTFCSDQHGGVNGRIRIFVNGRIVPEFMTKGWIYLDGISFVLM